MDNAKRENPNYNKAEAKYGSPKRQAKRRKPHRSVGSINDLSNEDAEFQQDDSTQNTGSFTRKQLKSMPQLKHDIAYGQYLHKPKSQKAIFTSQATKHRNKVIVSVVIAIVLIVIIYLLVVYSI